MATAQANGYKEKGNAAFKKGDHVLAIEMYTYATELDPQNPIFFTNRSNAYYLMKNYEKSERDARKAIKCKDSWEKGHYRLGMALWAQKNFKDAKVSFEMACSLKPDNATFASTLKQMKAEMMKGMSQAEVLKSEANEMFKAGKIEEAEKAYAKAINCAKNNEKDTAIKLDCYANRAACYRQLYLPEKCIDDCTAALEINPNHIKCLIRRGQALESMEKYKKSLADFQKVCTLDSNATLAFQSATRIRAAMKKLGIL